MTVVTSRPQARRAPLLGALFVLLVLGGAGLDPGVRADDARPVFVGNAACQECHPKQHAAWAKTPMAQSFARLAPGSEEKAKVGLDPRVDYRTNPSCVTCHAVGFGMPGGFRLNQDLEAAAKAGLLGVGCEACHGAAGRWLGEGLHDRALEDPAVRELRRPLLDAFGFVGSPGKPHCLECHNERSPTFQPFDYEQRKDQVSHERGA